MADEPVRQTTEIQAVSQGMLLGRVCFAGTNANVRPVIVENGVKLRLNIVDTPGYGDQINNEGWCVIMLCVVVYTCLIEKQLGPYH